MPTPCYISYHGMRILDKFPRKSHIPSDIYAHPAVSVFDRAFVVVLIKGITLTTFASFAGRITDEEKSLQLFPHLKAKMQVSILNVHKMFTYHRLSAMYQQASPL